MLKLIQPKIHNKLKKFSYVSLSFITILFVIFAFKYNETSIQKRAAAINKVAKNSHFLNLNNYLLEKINSPYLNIAHEIRKGENFAKILKIYNIDQKDIHKSSEELKKIIKMKKIKKGIIIDLVMKKNISGSLS